MIRAKFIISISIFITAALFIGEVYSFFLSDFESKYSNTGYWANSEEETDQVKEMVIKMTEDNNLPVFSLQKESQGAFSRTVTIYANEEAKQALKKGSMQILPGEKKSFFTGKTTFVFEDFEAIPAKGLRAVWYPVSRDDVMNATPKELEKYSGGFVRFPMQDESWIMIVVTWIAASIILLFLTWYDLVYSKKEQIVRIVLGADSAILMRNKIVKDLVNYSLAAIIAFIFMSIFTNTFFHIWISIICLVVFLALNTILIVLKMKVSSKRIEIKQSNASRGTLKISMGLKFVMGLLCVVVLSFAIGIAGEGKNLFDQRESYDTLNDRAHARLMMYPFDFEKIEFQDYNEGLESEQFLSTDSQLNDNYMRYAYKYLDCSTAIKATAFMMSDDKKIADKSIIANPKGIEHYKDSFPEWDYMIENEGDYLLIPENVSIEKIIEAFQNAPYLVVDEVYSYKEGVSIIAEEWQEPLEIKYSYKIDNPIILLDSHDYTNLSMYPPTYEAQSRPTGEVYGNLFMNSRADYIMQFSSVIDDEEKIKEFGKLLNSEIIDIDILEYEIVNLNNWYQELWGLIGSSMIITIVLTLLIFILRSQITIIILNLEYEVNAQELMIKKVMGFSIYERYKKMFMQTIIMFAAIMVAALVGYFVLEIGMIKYLLAGCLIVFITDILLMSIVIRRSDKIQISKVLKGGI